MAAAVAAAKALKKPKEVERPPWRPGNSNTAALAAKNSLLKAKLLDASRFDDSKFSYYISLYLI